MDALEQKYLFEAYYIDRTVYEQGVEDKSVRNPEKSAFYDIRPANGDEPYKDVPLWAFALRARPGFVVPESMPTVIAIDLRTGYFEVDGKTIVLHSEDVRGFEPLYYRIVNRHRTIEYQKKDGEITAMKDAGELVGYKIGWRGKDGKGENIERIITITFPKEA